MLVLLVVSTTAFAGRPQFIEAGSVDTAPRGEDKAPKPMAMEQNKVAAREMVQARTQEMKGELKQVRERLQACKDNYEDECRTVRKEARVTAKKHVFAAANKARILLEKFKDRIAKSDTPDVEKAELLTELEQKIQRIKNAGETVEAADAETSNVAIKDALKNLKSNWKEVQEKVKLKLHENYMNRFRNVFGKLSDVDGKLKRQVAKFGESGIEISTEAFDKFSADAKAAHEEAKNLFERAKTAGTEDQKELLAQAREKMKESHAFLKQAREGLKNIVQQMKDLKRPTTQTE